MVRMESDIRLKEIQKNIDMLKIGTSPFIEKHFKDDRYKSKLSINKSESDDERPDSPLFKLGNRVKVSGGGLQNRVKSIAGYDKDKASDQNLGKKDKKTGVSNIKKKGEEEIDNFLLPSSNPLVMKSCGVSPKSKSFVKKDPLNGRYIRRSIIGDHNSQELGKRLYFNKVTAEHEALLAETKKLNDMKEMKVAAASVQKKKIKGNNNT